MEMKMCCWMVVVCWLNSALARQEKKYFERGGTLHLRPATSRPITSMLWKHNGNGVAELFDGSTEPRYYSFFRNRTHLDITNGHLDITNTSERDVGVYSVEINYVLQTDTYDAKMITKVPQPSVWVRPDGDAVYTLSCEPKGGGVMDGTGPVTYLWKMGHREWMELGNRVRVEVNETTVQMETFTCKMVNPVSEKASEPAQNPFKQERRVGVIIAVVVSVLVVGAAGVYLVVAYLKKWIPFKPKEDAAVAPSRNSDALPMETDTLKTNGDA